MNKIKYFLLILLLVGKLGYSQSEKEYFKDTIDVKYIVKTNFSNENSSVALMFSDIENHHPFKLDTTLWEYKFKGWKNSCYGVVCVNKTEKNISTNDTIFMYVYYNDSIVSSRCRWFSMEPPLYELQSHFKVVQRNINCK